MSAIFVGLRSKMFRVVFFLNIVNKKNENDVNILLCCYYFNTNERSPKGAENSTSYIMFTYL